MKTAAAIATALVCLLLLTHPAVSGESVDKDTIPAQTPYTDLDRYFEHMLQAQKYVALGACFFTEERIEWQGYYGYADLEAKKPLDRDKIFQLASLSKTVTATALMQLCEKGL